MERDVVYHKEMEVDGVRYLVNHPQVEEAFEIGVELLKLIGGSAATMATASGGTEDKAASALGFAVSALLAKVHPRESMALIKRILKNVEAQGEVGGQNKKMMLDDAGVKKQFHAKLGSMLRLVGEVLEFTHADFFAAIAEGVASLMKKVEKVGDQAA